MHAKLFRFDIVRGKSRIIHVKASLTVVGRTVATSHLEISSRQIRSLEKAETQIAVFQATAPQVGEFEVHVT